MAVDACVSVNPFPPTTNLQQTPLKTNHAKTWKISINESIITEKNVENIVAKGEIAHPEQFLLLSQWFQKSSAADPSECVNKWERVNTCCDIASFAMRILYCN